MMKRSRDRERVIIIGASIAGSIAARVLAQAGVSITLIDKERFPRRKPCGEGLSARGQAELESAGCSLKTLGCSHQPLEGYRIIRGRASLVIPERTGLVGVSRAELDLKLLECVTGSPLIDVVLGESAVVRDLAPGACKVVVGSQEISGGTLIIADGASSPTLRALGRSLATPTSPRFGTSSAWRLTGGRIEPKVHSVLVPGGEVYLTPLSDGRLNVSALGGQKLIQQFSRVPSLKAQVSAIGETLGVSLTLEHPPLGCGPVNTTYRGAQSAGAFVVGDACETFDPCAGFGMTHALLSGRLAGACVLDGLGRTDLSTALLNYERAREARVRDVRGFTRLTSLTMVSRAGRMSLPALVSTGLAGMVSESVHGCRHNSAVRGLVTLLGFNGSNSAVASLSRLTHGRNPK